MADEDKEKLEAEAKAKAEAKAEADAAAERAKHPELHDPNYSGKLTADAALARLEKFGPASLATAENKPAAAPQTKAAK